MEWWQVLNIINHLMKSIIRALGNEIYYNSTVHRHKVLMLFWNTPSLGTLYMLMLIHAMSMANGRIRLFSNNLKTIQTMLFDTIINLLNILTTLPQVLYFIWDLMKRELKLAAPSPPKKLDTKQFEHLKFGRQERKHN